MRNYLSYRITIEDHPKGGKVHTFKFDSEAERDAFQAGLDFVCEVGSDPHRPVSVKAAEVGLPDIGARVAPALIVRDFSNE